MRSLLLDAPMSLATVEGLPARLAEYAVAPPQANDWVTEAELWGMTLAVYDLSFADQGGLAAFEKWVHGINHRLMGSPLYRVLFAVVSPERILRGVASRMAVFHRGTVTEDIQVSSGRGPSQSRCPEPPAGARAHRARHRGARSPRAWARDGHRCDVTRHRPRRGLLRRHVAVSFQRMW